MCSFLLEKRKPIKVLTNYGRDNGGGYTSSKKISWIMIHLYDVRYIQQKVRFILSPNYNVIKQKVIFMDLKEKNCFYLILLDYCFKFAVLFQIDRLSSTICGAKKLARQGFCPTNRRDDLCLVF